MLDIKNLRVNLEAKMLESDKVIIVPHRRADFDAIASSIGIAMFADKLKKESHILINDQIYDMDHGVQNIIAEAKDIYPTINVETYRKIEGPNDLFVLTDVNKQGLIHLDGISKDKKRLVIIDHHNKDDETLDAVLEHIDTSASSASEIIANLLFNAKIKINPEVANYLLAGILLDTNKLSKNVTSETMKIVSKLFESGANMTTASNYFTEDFNSDRRVQELVNTTRFLNYTVAIIMGEENTEYTREELAKAADYLLRYRIDASYAIGSIGNDTVSISARSKDIIDVGSVMQELDGGGSLHSGATKLEGITVEEAGKRLMKVIFPPHIRNQETN
ncbi:MAG: DHH family phosphoesterase [Bacilli bacterium]|nr:DHH family phosphoesterase [Bacilli bacterium]